MVIFLLGLAADQQICLHVSDSVIPVVSAESFPLILLFSSCVAASTEFLSLLKRYFEKPTLYFQDKAKRPHFGVILKGHLFEKSFSKYSVPTSSTDFLLNAFALRNEADVNKTRWKNSI